ncbi:MAG: sodium:proton antiporter, partial [Muribaculaceae bacterium]|nr:sodium:proton antiporter [Muribaculaceae bacterium]
MAFMGIGQVMGYSDPWIAGAVISGAYFGDKVSPLSDTTVVASSSCGVDLFTHIRYLLLTAGPSMGIALLVFLIEGLIHEPTMVGEQHSQMLDVLHITFNITPWVLIVPAITLLLIALKLNTMITLAISSALGVVAMLIFQPQIPLDAEYIKAVWSGAVFNTSDQGFNDLVSTSGVLGMLPTIYLVLSAMLFGGAMIGTGMLRAISTAITRKLKGVKGIIGATIGSGLMLNGFTADQYLSIIIGANMYKEVYARTGLEAKKLSRTLEDSISVTSVLIPWNSCGLTQSAVLGVSTIAYFPYCVFNYLSPVMSFVMSTGILKVRRG